MRISKQVRLKAYKYALEAIKNREDFFFICWQLEKYLIFTNKINEFDYIDYDAMIKWFPELWNKAPKKIKEKGGGAWFDSNQLSPRVKVLNKCIKELTPVK